MRRRVYDLPVADRAAANDRGRIPRAGLLGEARVAELSNSVRSRSERKLRPSAEVGPRFERPHMDVRAGATYQGWLLA